jgi:hypothetical protein
MGKAQQICGQPLASEVAKQPFAIESGNRVITHDAIMAGRVITFEGGGDFAKAAGFYGDRVTSCTKTNR